MKLHSFYLFIVRKVRVADHPQEPEVAAHVLLPAEGQLVLGVPALVDPVVRAPYENDERRLLLPCKTKKRCYL